MFLTVYGHQQMGPPVFLTVYGHQQMGPQTTTPTVRVLCQVGVTMVEGLKGSQARAALKATEWGQDAQAL